MNKTLSTLVLALAAGVSLTSQAADDAAAVTKQEAKSLKATSDGDYKARKNLAEAKEDLDKADCKANLEGSTKRACDASAKADAKARKANAKVVHEAEDKTIKDAKK